jgi:hypothetical protein
MQSKNNGYTAGILDGEGCISIYISKRWDGRQMKNVYRPVLEISIYQADERLIKWLLFHYGGKRYEHTMKNSSRPGWQWTAPRGKAREDFLLEILPYLILKRDQALLALEYMRLPQTWDQRQKRFDLAYRCSELNRKRFAQSKIRDKYFEAMKNIGASPTTNTQGIIDDIVGIKIESELHGNMQNVTPVMGTTVTNLEGADPVRGLL